MNRLALASLILASLLTPLAASADSFYTLVRYECVPAKNQIIISPKQRIIDTDFEGDCHNMGPVVTNVYK